MENKFFIPNNIKFPYHGKSLKINFIYKLNFFAISNAKYVTIAEAPDLLNDIRLSIMDSLSRIPVFNCHFLSYCIHRRLDKQKQEF